MATIRKDVDASKRKMEVAKKTKRSTEEEPIRLLSLSDIKIEELLGQ